MTKFSQIPQNTNPLMTDLLVGVSGGNTDDVITIQSLTNLIAANFPAQQAWQTPTLATGWGAWDAGASGTITGRYGYPRYYKDSLGMVHLDGLAKNTSAGANTTTTNFLIFTLPVGYRPSHVIRAVTTQGNTSSDTYSELNIDVDGTVTLTGAVSVPAGQWTSLNNIHFRAEA